MNRFRTDVLVFFVALFGISAVPAPSQLFAVGSGGLDYSSSLFRIDDPTTTPVAVEIGESGVPLTALAIHPHTGRFYGIDEGFTSLYELNPTTGAASLIGFLGTLTFPVGNQAALDFDPLGRLWVWGLGSFTSVAMVDLQSGEATEVGATPFPGSSMAFAPDGTLFGAAQGWLVRIEAGNGTGNHWHVNLQAPGYAGLEIDETGWGLGAYFNNGQVYLELVDPWTGFRLPAAVVAGAANLGIAGLAWTNSPGLIRIGAGVSSTTVGLEWLPGGAGSSLRSALKFTGLQQTAAGNAVAYLVLSSALASPPIPLGSQFLFGDLNSLLDVLHIVPQANGELTVPLNLQQAQLIGSYVAQIVQITTTLAQTSLEASMAIIANLN